MAGKQQQGGRASAQDRVNQVGERTDNRKVAIYRELTADKAVAFVKSVAPNMDARALLNVAYAHVVSRPELQACTPKSIIQSVAEAAKLGLNVDGYLGQAYLVPFRDRATMMVGFRGGVGLAYDSGKVSRVHGDVICEKDDYEYVEGIAPVFHHSKPLGDRGKMIGAYAIAHPVGGGIPWIAVLSEADIEVRRKASQTGRAKKGPWVEYPEAMWIKSAFRALMKTLPVPKLQAIAIREDVREKEQAPVGMDPELETLDLGEAETVPDDPPAKEEPPKGGKKTENKKADGCPKCGLLSANLRADGSCPDCDPPAEGGDA